MEKNINQKYLFEFYCVRFMQQFKKKIINNVRISKFVIRFPFLGVDPAIKS